METQQ